MREQLLDGLVLIDGHCVLCSAAFRFVAQRDPGVRFRFAALQTPLGQRMASDIGIDPDNPDSFAVILEGRALLKSDGALRILLALPGWRWCKLLLLVPRPLRDWVYDRIACNRYRIFGRRDRCIIPDAALAAHMARRD